MRLRIRYARLGKVRFTSHRDVARIWERALRRTELPVAYSAGFSPRPKLAFGLALPTGAESVAEYLDVELAGAGPVPDELPDRLSAALPAGLDVLAVAPLEAGADSLQHAVTSCTWTVEVLDLDADRAESLVAAALAAGTLVVTRQRKGKAVTDDLRPALLALGVNGPTPAGVELHAELSTQPRGVRTSELLAALDPGLQEGLVRRTHQWIQRDDGRVEPLPLERLPGTVGAHTSRVAERVS